MLGLDISNFGTDNLLTRYLGFEAKEKQVLPLDGLLILGLLTLLTYIPELVFSRKQFINVYLSRYLFSRKRILTLLFAVIFFIAMFAALYFMSKYPLALTIVLSIAVLSVVLTAGLVIYKALPILINTIKDLRRVKKLKVNKEMTWSFLCHFLGQLSSGWVQFMFIRQVRESKTMITRSGDYLSPDLKSVRAGEELAKLKEEILGLNE